MTASGTPPPDGVPLAMGAVRIAMRTYKRGGLVFEAVIFDMDGLVFDTERLAKLAWQDVGAHFGVSIGEEVLSQIRGAGNCRGGAALFKRRVPMDEAMLILALYGERRRYPMLRRAVLRAQFS